MVERVGLRVVSPEAMSLEAQARCCADARLVVGEYGSVLMNAMFCHPGAVVAAIGRRSQLLGAICALGGARRSFFDPLGDPHTADGYRVDPEAFAGWLNALFLATGVMPPARSSLRAA